MPYVQKLNLQRALNMSDRKALALIEFTNMAEG